jgi:rubrerythrin
MYEADHSRRDLLVAGGAVLAAAAVPLLVGVRDAIAQAGAGDDESILAAAITLEVTAAEAYQRSQTQLGGVARLFRNQEREHAAALGAALRDMGGTPRATVDQNTLNGLAAAASRRDRALFAINLENTAVRAYEDAHRKLRDARTMQVVTTILGNQAQHLVVLRQIAGRQPVPDAFERGRS